MVKGACMVKGGGICGEGGHTWQREHVWQVGHAWQEGGYAWQGRMHAEEMATEAGGTHPTGMHSCYHCEGRLNPILTVICCNYIRI